MRNYKAIFLLLCFAVLMFTSCGRPVVQDDTLSPVVASSSAVMPTAAGLAHIQVQHTSFPIIHMPSQPAPDFALTWTSLTCGPPEGGDVLDTLHHTFKQDRLGAPSITIPLTLTATEMATVYSKMVAINFWGYPSTFAIQVPKGAEETVQTPATTYRFVVRNGGQTKTLAWEDEIVQPTSPEADRLRELIHIIRGLVEARPAWKNLPPLTAGCD